jgi:hypothetical protein
MLTIAAYDKAVEQLFDVLNRLAKAIEHAGIDYRIIGGMAVFIHVMNRHETKARLTRDVDVAVNRQDLERIASAVEPFGFRFRHAASMDRLLDTTRPGSKSAVHFVLPVKRSGENMSSRSQYLPKR